MKEKIFCMECNTQTDLVIDSFSRYHLKKYHNMSMKEYYDKHIKKEKEGICLNCKKQTKFLSYNRGYQQFCSNICTVTSDYSKQKISKSFEYRNVELESKKRKNTTERRYGVSHISQCEKIKIRKQNTCIEKYGVISNLLTEDCKNKRNKSLKENKENINKKRKKYWTDEHIFLCLEKRKKTCIDRYGEDNVFKLEKTKNKIRNTLENLGRWESIDSYNDFYKYRLKVSKITRTFCNELFENWDGTDYYTGEKLLLTDEFKIYNNNHPNTNKLQPTIDHKISIFYGFKNNISEEVISNIDNLCICSRKNNSLKNYKCEEEFIEFLKNKEVK